MARGWESKNVESQIEERDMFGPLKPAFNPNVPKDSELQRELELLEMTKKRLFHEIAFASTRRFREMQQRALSHVDTRIQELSASKRV